jgi:hypothetical protein
MYQSFSTFSLFYYINRVTYLGWEKRRERGHEVGESGGVGIEGGGSGSLPGHGATLLPLLDPTAGPNLDSNKIVLE